MRQGGAPNTDSMQKREHISLREAVRIIKSLSFLIKNEKSRLVLLLVLIMFTIMCQLIIPVMIQGCLNSFVERGMFPDIAGRITGILISLVIVFVLSSVFNYFKTYVSASISERVALSMRKTLYKKLVTIPVSTLNKLSYGDIMSRLTNDSMAVCSFVQVIDLLLSTVCLITGCGIIMLLESPTLTLITVVAALVSVLVVRFISKLSYGPFLIRQTRLGKYNSHIEETFQNYRTIDITGSEKRAVDKNDKYSLSLYKASVKATLLSGLANPVMLVLGNLGFLATVTAGAYLAIDGFIAIGALQAVIMYSKQFTDSVFNIGNAAVQVQTSLASAKRVAEILNENSEENSRTDSGKADSEFGVVFDNVSFGYDGYDKVLKNCSFAILKNRKTAIVGKTGAGKTTIINLLLKFFDNYEGEIYFDGQNIKELSPSSIREKTSVILQDSRITEGTVWENLVYGAEERSRDEILKISELAEVDRFVKKLPDGYDTVISENDERITKGQKQKIALARAFISDANLIIMDEAASSLDKETEKRIQDKLFGYKNNLTFLIIAHRLETIQNSDVILVLENGEITESGKHTELMNLNGEYFRLFSGQTQGKEI